MPKFETYIFEDPLYGLLITKINIKTQRKTRKKKDNDHGVLLVQVEYKLHKQSHGSMGFLFLLFLFMRMAAAPENSKVLSIHV